VRNHLQVVLPPGDHRDDLTRMLFSNAGGRPISARACHQPWPLHRARAQILEDNLLTTAGLPVPRGEPLVHYSPGVDVAIGRPEP
jgi:uncharacterized protein YqjF (DUF2071 family)